MLSNKEFIKNLVIAAAFIALGLLMPGSTLTDPAALTANITGISLGVGIGWLIKTFIAQKSANKEA
ncbi:MAG: hypothetical protein Q8O64_13210 [Sideroxyarcus sp.]|nr:hypothetical protein [Sideroxyarcus sp.]